MQAKPTIVCLCGSTRFYKTFMEHNYLETMAGRIVLSVGFYPHAVAEMHGEGVGITPEQKEELDQLHMRKIDLADEIFVLNCDGYIGSSTAREIAYAHAHGKRVRFLEDEAMNQDITDALARLAHALENEARAKDRIRAALARLVTAVEHAGSHFESNLPDAMAAARTALASSPARPAEHDGTRAELDATRRVLAAMVNQYMAFPEGFISHEFMSAQEDAIELLEHIGWLMSGPLERYYWTDAARAAMVGDTVIPRAPGDAP